MIHLLWYVSLIIESGVFALLVYRGEWPMFALWLGFDVITGVAGIIVDRMDPHNGAYRIPWTLKMPVATVLRVVAAKEVWVRLGGPRLTRACIFASGLVYLGSVHVWPHTVVEIEIVAYAMVSAALAMILYRSIREGARKISVGANTMNHAWTMCGYCFLSAVIYLVSWAYPYTISIGSGLLATLAYGIWGVIFIRARG